MHLRGLCRASVFGKKARSRTDELEPLGEFHVVSLLEGAAYVRQPRICVLLESSSSYEVYLWN